MCVCPFVYVRLDGYGGSRLLVCSDHGDGATAKDDSQAPWHLWPSGAQNLRERFEVWFTAHRVFHPAAQVFLRCHPRQNIFGQIEAVVDSVGIFRDPLAGEERHSLCATAAERPQQRPRRQTSCWKRSKLQPQ